MIKDIVVNLAVGAERDAAAQYAISIADTLGAHLAGVAFSYEPTPPPTIIGTMPLDFLATQREESEKLAKDTLDKFDKAARAAGISAEARMINATIMGAAEAFGRIARRFDISVVGQNEPERPGRAEPIVDAALFEAGRPVVVVPYIQRAAFSLNRVLVCWDGGKTAARAIGDALPFLSRAKVVEIVIVASEKSKSDELPGADMGEHLARHAPQVEVKRLATADQDVPNTLLSYAADVSADFMVMGGYGHSRLREFILGGATRGILNAMTVPTLMSH